MTTDEIIEGEVTEVPETRALAVVAPAPSPMGLMSSGLAALAQMTEAEFDRNLESMALVRTRVDKVKKAAMRDGTDYGPPFPGSDKDTLLKPGAETLLRTFNLADSYRVERITGDGDETPDVEFIVHASIHLGATDGPVIATGLGGANSFETKHRYRGDAGRVCPECGTAAIKRGKDFHTQQPNWYCNRKQDGCGSNFPLHDQRIEGQAAGKQENEDPWDLANTLLKMAKKRALVDGVLTATATSGLFSQDEVPGPKPPPASPSAAASSSPTASSGAPSAAPATGSSSGSTTRAAPTTNTAGPWEGTVREEPDGVREGPGGKKLELKLKVGGKNMTAIFTGDGASRAYDCHNGDKVRVAGLYHERKWADDKPPAKEIHNPTYLARATADGGWETLWDVGTQATIAEAAEVPSAAPAPVSVPQTSAPATPAAAEVWAEYPEDATVNERVVLESWELRPHPDPAQPAVFRAIFRRPDGSKIQATHKLSELVADGYLDVEMSHFRWEPGTVVQLVGVYAKRDRARGWVLITMIGDPL